MKHFLTIILSFLHLVVYCQERINPKSATYINKVWELSSATGWAKDGPTGVWKNSHNKIPARVEILDNKVSFFESEKWGIDNFYKIELHRIKHNGDTFYLFIKYYNEGKYYYEHIKHDWYDYKICQAFVLKYEPAKVDSIMYKENGGLHFDFTIVHQIEPLELFDKWLPAKSITSKIFLTDTTSYTKYNIRLHFTIQPNKAKNRIRFVFGTASDNMALSSPTCEDCHQIELYSFYVFNEYYFESSYPSLLGLIKY